MTTRQELRELSRLAAPVVVTQLASMSMGLVAALFAGRLGTDALAGVGAGNAYVFGLFVVGLGVMLALDPLASQAVGAGRHRDAGHALQHTVVAAAALSVPLSLGVWFAGPVIRMLGQDDAVVPQAAAFARSQAWSLFPFMLYFALRNYLQAHGNVRPAMVLAIVGNVVHAGIAWLLVRGVPGWWSPQGTGGLGLAAAVSRLFMAAGLLYAVLKDGDLEARGLVPGRGVVDGRAVRRVLGIGLPIGFQLGFEVWVFNAATLLAGWLGPAPQAGHGIALNLASLAFMVPLGVAIATSVRVGQAVGRADPGGAARAAGTGYAVGIAAVLVSAAAFGLFPVALVSLFGTGRDAASIAVTLLPIAAAFQVLDAAQVIGASVLRGAADTRFAMWVNLGSHWGIGLPIGVALAFAAGWGVVGLWWGLTLGLGLVAVVLGLRVRWRLRPDRLQALGEARRRTV